MTDDAAMRSDDLCADHALGALAGPARVQDTQRQRRGGELNSGRSGDCRCSRIPLPGSATQVREVGRRTAVRRH